MTDEALEAYERQFEDEADHKAVAFDALVARATKLGFPSVTAALDRLESLMDDR